MKRNRKVVCLAVAMLAMTCLFVGPATADGIGSFCNDVADLLGIGQDTCVTCVNGGNNDNVCLCKFYGDIGLLDALGVSHGQCVKYLNSL